MRAAHPMEDPFQQPREFHTDLMSPSLLSDLKQPRGPYGTPVQSSKKIIPNRCHWFNFIEVLNSLIGTFCGHIVKYNKFIILSRFHSKAEKNFRDSFQGFHDVGGGGLKTLPGEKNAICGSWLEILLEAL